MRTFNAIIALTLFLSSPLFATHLRAVEIKAKQIDCNSLTFEITVIGYVNYHETSVVFGGESSLLDFGDGLKQSIPDTPSEIVDEFLKVGIAKFTILHTYSTAGNYTISFTQPSRNAGILNMDESVLTLFYTETRITVDQAHCNASPQFLVPPIDRACTGITFYHNAGAVDFENDSLSYELVTPQRARGVFVTNYIAPHNKKFYDAAGINFNTANEEKNGPPLLSIDPITGTLTWNAPGVAGEYAIAIKVVEWKFNATDSTWYQAGYVIRDMQIIVESCDNRKPNIIVPSDICVVAGNTVQFNVSGSDPDFDPVLIEVFSEIFTLHVNAAQKFPSEDVVQSTQPPHDTAAMRIQWNTSCAHVRNQPYQIVFKITDRPPSGPRLVQFKTVTIKVIAPEPEYETVTVNPVSKKVSLQWKDYACDNVQAFQIWRRVSEYEYNPPACVNGMPDFLRYKLLTEVSFDVKSYIDNDIAIGALYCYRIVALVGNNKVPGRISLDTCIIPKPAEAPVITHVSVLKTDATQGEILVRWTSPFEIDKAQYPPPYQYKVYRSSGMYDPSFFELATTESITDTMFVDKQLNTKEVAYRYQIEMYVPALTVLPVDSSSMASSVFAEIKPYPDRIELTWDANTPWYNYLQRHPHHLVYRSNTPFDEDFVALGSVNVNENGFYFADDGTFQNQSLKDGVTYYYKVLTRGGYGNPKIKEPFENLSQIISSMLLDITPPCAPRIAIQKQDCKTLPCSQASYHNEITWSFPDDSCIEPDLTFELFFAETEDEDFKLLASLSDFSYRHERLASQAKCYKVIAIDRAGNKSEFSETICIDNCAYFELPNVFTPGNNDGVNDFFSAFHADSPDESKCARFVKKVNLKIFDRWGKEIYSVHSDSENDNHIFWNGLTAAGEEVSTGIYFYKADVLFDVRNPSEKSKAFKGWVQVVR